MLISNQLGPLPRGTINPTKPGVTPTESWSDLVIGDSITLAGTVHLAAVGVTLPAGMYQRCTVLGQVYSPASVVNVATTNAGNGSLGNIWTGPTPIDWSIEAGVGSPPVSGVGAVTPGDPATFTVTDRRTGLKVGACRVGSSVRIGQAGFTITAGSVPFNVGDLFTLEAFNPAPIYQPCVHTATDGSQVPMAILADDTATFIGGPVARAYTAGVFRAAALIIDPSWAPGDIIAALASASIICR